MIERFFEQEIHTEIEKLEEGIFVEKIQRSIDVESPSEDFYYGNYQEGTKGWVFDVNPDKNLSMVVHMLLNQMYEDVDIQQDNLEYFSKIDAQNMSIGDFTQVLYERELHVEEYSGLNLKETLSLLDDDGKLLCFLSADILEGTSAVKLKGLAPNRVVELIGVDISNPINIRAFYNDPTCEDGCGKSCGWKKFNSAWDTSGKYAMFIFKG